jgi:hypothetical protein
MTRADPKLSSSQVMGARGWPNRIAGVITDVHCAILVYTDPNSLVGGPPGSGSIPATVIWQARAPSRHGSPSFGVTVCEQPEYGSHLPRS